MGSSNTQKLQSQSHWKKIPRGTNLPQGEVRTEESYNNSRKFKYESEYQELSKFVKFSEWKDKDVLEVGCGLGNDSQTWCEAGAHLTAIDSDSVALEMTAELLKTVGQEATLKQANALELPFDDQSFDLYYAWGVLMHTGDTQKAIDEAHRVLRKDGQAIIMLYNRNSLLFRFHVQLLKRKFDNGAPIVDFYTNKEMKEICGNFELLEMKNYYFLRENVSSLGKVIPKPIEEFLGKYWGYCTYLRLVKGLKWKQLKWLLT